ncbi:hypothetical protein [Microbacterium sp. zg-YB36]|uniref:hypothetical protein n=1 Tax=Microbacterium sp. zg-YB36 TaxID=2969407 RepID=UPI00214C1D35|nr:hypothetical protein [Microbacterium sp. zg-YB36]MDL5351203.1 hypothetical protein [Microbacterium sp. zg-YB36]
MAVNVKETDGARSIEITERDGVVYVDGGRFCYGFDRSIFLRAIERELGVWFLSSEEEGVDQAV